MKRLHILLAGLILLSITACDFPTILGGESSRDGSLAAADTLLYVTISGGFAGVSQELLVQTDGTASFEDHSFTRQKWSRALTDDEVDGLVAFLIANQFFVLQSNYLEPPVADAFIYTIRFKNKDKQKSVTTNYFAAPENLKRIVDRLLELKDSVTENGLNLTLNLDKSSMQAGESVQMTLTVTNTTGEVLTLHFPTGQIFDFYVFEQSFATPLVWNWAHDKVFTQAAMEIILQPQESRAFEVSWNGTDNTGAVVNGSFEIQAELRSTPGGTTPRREFTIVSN